MSAIVLIVVAKLLLYYWLVDVFTGIYHYLTDKGYNIRRQVLEFRNHHDNPASFTFDWYPVAGAIPLLLLGLLHTDFLFVALWVSFLQIPHLAAHKRWDNKLLRFLRWTGAFITVEQHAEHHDGVFFDKNYCIMTCWNNWWFNKVTDLIPLEDREVV